MSASSGDPTRLIWAVLGLIFTVFVICPYLYNRRKQ